MRWGLAERKICLKYAFARIVGLVNLRNSATESQLQNRFSIMSATTLAELPVGTDAIVQAMPTGRSCLTRLREMGIVPGARVRVTRRAPFGEPIEICVRGSHLSMRNHEAAFIAISPAAA